jgi:hypothetical protein
MKLILCKIICMKKIVLSFLIVIPFIAQAQVDSVTIVRPAPGNNDSTDQGGANGGKDAYVYQSTSTTNYGNSVPLAALPLSSCNATDAFIYIQFDLTGLPDTAVDSVFVGFTHYADSTYCYSNCTADFYFAAVTQPWSESTITYADMPAQDTGYLYGPVHLAFPFSSFVKEYNITTMYKKWRNGAVPNYGMVIYSTTMGCNNAAVAFSIHSSDDTVVTDRPYLKIHQTIDTTNHHAFVQNQRAGSLDLALYPNPTTSDEKLSFVLPSAGIIKLLVTDITGRDLFQTQNLYMAGYNTINIPLSSYDAGLYLLNIVTPQGTLMGKIIKQ